jgi:integrase
MLADATIKEVMERLGHTDPKTTTVIYTHVTQPITRNLKHAPLLLF